ncbi:CBASS cGAMP-activated phospholipase [Herminiimonas fonticola]|uniref:Patatin-like phospholipase/acyl hydrolase n=1 Tax=Herminiimonas fonticola TaxID=303380 RepID=A0A4R6G1C7_9BURK|nr:CBASS cGAMP-activated phospholipase [Herminiimonas fonticola]RBA24361.1 Patatin-like phospholipase [Herminiimonas fonticola]TDN87305.1 patatin-like phospholipase/acyl hydrolase [Herminiimonas fonticola]
MNWNKEQPFQALALTGGGYRGLFTAHALDVIEKKIGEPIGRRFDLVCGTSIGGIVALAVAFEIPMEKVVKVFMEDGEKIFPPERRAANARFEKWDLYTHLDKARYDSKPLRDAITKLVPADALLKDAVHPLAIPAVNVTQGIPQVFKTRHKQEWERDWKFKAVDVALATAAAPTFFELAEIGNNLYADGGLFANAPDLIALHEAEYFFQVPIDCFRLLSVGTTTKSYSLSHSTGRDFGIRDWMQDQRLFSVMISSQQQFVEQLVAHRLKNQYLRIDHEPSNEQTSDLGLDLASVAAQKTLMGLSEKLVTDILGTKLLPYLDHKPQLKIYRGE